MHFCLRIESVKGRSSMKVELLTGAFAVLATALTAAGETVVSPDGRTSCAFMLRDGHPEVEVSFAGKPVFSGGVGVRDQAYDVIGTDVRTVRSDWRPVWGFRRTYPENYAELTVRLGKAGHPVAAETLFIRCYDEGFAVRSDVVMAAYSLGTFSGERTEWRFAPGTAAWGITGGEDTFPADPVPVERLEADRRYCLPLTLRVPGAGYASVLEAHAERYPRSFLRARDGRLKFEFAAGLKEGRGVNRTPWRVALLAATPAELVERAYLVENLNPPCALEDTSWIRPGFCVSDSGNFELRTEEILAAVPAIAAAGAKYLQIDWGWYGTEVPWTDDDRAVYLSRHPELKSDANLLANTAADPFTVAVGTVPYNPYQLQGGRTGVSLDIPAVVRALRSHGIGLCLYVHGMVLEANDLDRLFATYASWGVVGLKPGFVGYGPQSATDFLRRLAATAARHKLWLDIHDAQVPDGMERTYPNLMITEGGGGEEGDHPVRQDVALPFTRCLAGPFDFTPRLFHAGRAQATKAHKLALFAVYPGPTAVMRGRVRELAERNAPAAAFLRALPWNYDATHVRDAEIARHLTVVREKDGSFYIGAITGDAAHVTSLTLDFLAPGRDYALESLADDPDSTDVPRAFRCERRTVRRGDVLRIEMAAAGGFCGVIK